MEEWQNSGTRIGRKDSKLIRPVLMVIMIKIYQLVSLSQMNNNFQVIICVNHHLLWIKKTTVSRLTFSLCLWAVAVRIVFLINPSICRYLFWYMVHNFLQPLNQVVLHLVIEVILIPAWGVTFCTYKFLGNAACGGDVWSLGDILLPLASHNPALPPNGSDDRQILGLTTDSACCPHVSNYSARIPDYLLDLTIGF